MKISLVLGTIVPWGLGVQAFDSNAFAKHVISLSSSSGPEHSTSAAEVQQNAGRSLRTHGSNSVNVDLVNRESSLIRKLDEDDDEDDDDDEEEDYDDNYNEDDDEDDDIDKDTSCDVAMLGCLGDAKCASCFVNMNNAGIDWASVSQSTTCSMVIGLVSQSEQCSHIEMEDSSIDAFCTLFQACAIYKSGGDYDNNSQKELDCNSLTSCWWEGIHPSFVGNGICNDAMDGCYNSEICRFDGGDCCEDTCDTSSFWAACGNDGYVCRDPESGDCNPDLPLSNCPDPTDDFAGGLPVDDDYVNPAAIDCGPDQSLYRLIMYDSFGDGWDTTKLTIKMQGGSDTPIFEGGLKSGSQGTKYICLSMDSSCYDVTVEGGSWGREVSWQVKYYGDGAPAIAGGGAPERCQFPIADGDCENTCFGRPNIDPTDDPDYETFKELIQCINDKCFIQAGICKNEDACNQCYGQESPDTGCYAIDSFNALVDCSVCKCGEKTGSDFCDEKVAPGMIIPPAPIDPTEPEPCTPGQTMKGSKAVVQFSQCSDFDSVGMLVTDFDQNHFGLLDKFEACSHEYATRDRNGGHTALGCLSLLANAIDGNPEDIDGGDEYDVEMLEAIGSLAKHLYQNASTFCDCASSASKECPFCPSFAKFKTLLYESIDACDALDEIDCAAWDEYQGRCRREMIEEFGGIDLGRVEQCSYFMEGCRHIGPFPAFRRLDCEEEIGTDSWDFYDEFYSRCMNGRYDALTQAPTDFVPVVPVASPSRAPVTAPTPNYKPIDNESDPTSAPVVVPVAAPTLNPVVAPTLPNSPNYVPTDGGSTSWSSTEDKVPKEKRKSHFFRNLFVLCLFGGVGYYVYRRRSDGFQFIRYRRMRTNYGGDEDMYSGLSLESSTTFQPPALPPPPTEMQGNSFT